MDRLHFQGLRAAALLVLGLAAASASVASGVVGAQAPAASSVQAARHQPASAQADESASLREGAVTALDERGSRLQVQGVWLAIVAGKTQIVRQGRKVGADTLKVGETIRFTVAPAGTEAPSLRMVYAP